MAGPGKRRAVRDLLAKKKTPVGRSKSLKQTATKQKAFSHAVLLHCICLLMCYVLCAGFWLPATMI